MILFCKIIDLCIFDLDGTLVSTKSGNTFRKSADDWQWIPGRLGKVQALGNQVNIGLATNQGGIAFGYFPFIDLMNEIQKAVDEIRTMPANAVKVCWTHPKGTIAEYHVEDDPRRKPNPGMLFEVMEEFQFPINPSRVLFVGDRPEDEEAAKNCGCNFMLADEFFAEKEEQHERRT